MFKQSDQTITLKGTVRLTQPLPNITKKRRWGGTPNWRFELVPASRDGQSAKPVPVVLDAALSVKLIKGMLHEGDDVEVEVAFHNECSCGNHIRSFSNHSMGLHYFGGDSYLRRKTDGTPESDERSVQVTQQDLRKLRGVLRTSVDEGETVIGRRSHKYTYVVETVDATGRITDQLPFVVCGLWWKNTLVGDFLRDGDELEVKGELRRGVLYPEKITNHSLEKQSIAIALPSKAPLHIQASYILATFGIIVIPFSFIGTLIGVLSQNTPLVSLVQITNVLGLILMAPYSILRWGWRRALQYAAALVIGVILAMLVSNISVDAKYAIEYKGKDNLLSLMADPSNAQLRMHYMAGFSRNMAAVGTNLTLFILFLTPLVAFFIYVRLFSKPSKERIKIEGIAQNVDVRTVAAQPVEFLGKFLNFGNIEVLSFRLLTKASAELARFVPAKFMQSTDSSDEVLVGVEMRGHLEGMVKDGDELAFEAWNTAFVLGTDQIGNVSTLTTVRAKQAPQWINFLAIIAVVFLVGLFLREQIIGVVQGMAASALPPPTPTP